jgi:hypothetical protein
MRLKFSSVDAPSSDLIDAVMDGYVMWREQRAAVEETYRAWGAAPAEQRPSAYADYRTALDREEHAANEYQRLVERAARLDRV